MRADEQTYPIEKPTAVESVWKFSAFQIAFLLRATDHEAMFEAARDYLDAADELDRTADTIRNGATDLAAAWRGNAAGDSLSQLRQYYASARSLAAECRASAVAMEHAAQALGEARYREALLPGGDFPSTDPSSLESLEYQKVLSDLNGAYREAIALAPNQLAISVPGGQPIERTKWEDVRSGLAVHPATELVGDTHDANTTQSSIPPPDRRRDIPNLPIGPDPKSNHPRGPGAPKHHTVPDRDLPVGGSGHDRHLGGDPFAPRTALAGIVSAPNQGLPSPGSGERTPPTLGDISRSLPGGREASRGGPGSLGRSTGGANNQSGVIPAGLGRGDHEEGQRERRYYLPEDLDVWGNPDVVPSVIYGEFEQRTDDDDDDDF